MVWEVVLWFLAASLITLKGRITAEKHREVLAD
jgi:hypothetical protein